MTQSVWFVENIEPIALVLAASNPALAPGALALAVALGCKINPQQAASLLRLLAEDTGNETQSQLG